MKLFHLFVLVIIGLMHKYTEISSVVISAVDTCELLTAQRNRAIANGLLSGQFSDKTNILTYLICSSYTFTMWRFFFLHFDHFTDGRTAWTSDQLVARPFPKHRTTQTQNKHVPIPKIHALSGIRNHDPGFRASEGSACLRSLGYRDRLDEHYTAKFFTRN
jgi:hypothetical protein